MKKTKWKKRYIAGVAALILMLAGIRISSIYAANEIDLSRSCSLTLEVAESGAFAEDLSGIELQVKLYRVADVSVNGTYTSDKKYQSLEIEKLTGEDNLEETSQKAAEIAEGTEADAEFTIAEGRGTAEGLEPGMYLVRVENGITDLYEYSFQPYLIALPENQDGEWQYDVTGGLKPEQNPRYGDLKIRKTLSAYNTSLKEVSFVFQIEGADQKGDIVYSNVVSTTHDGAGTKEILVSHIPAGTTVTVTEVYSGASYRAESSPEQTVVITAEEMVTAEFSNTYDDRLVPGYGVTNHFEYDEEEGWQWSQLSDNSTAEE